MQSKTVEPRCHVESRDNLAWKARGDVTLLGIPQEEIFERKVVKHDDD